MLNENHEKTDFDEKHILILSTYFKWSTFRPLVIWWSSDPRRSWSSQLHFHPFKRCSPSRPPRGQSSWPRRSHSRPNRVHFNHEKLDRRIQLSNCFFFHFWKAFFQKASFLVQKSSWCIKIILSKFNKVT